MGRSDQDFFTSLRRFALTGAVFFSLVAGALAIVIPSAAAQWTCVRCPFPARMATHRTWFISVFFEETVKPALDKMTENLQSIAMYQMQISGSFFDAAQQIETMRTLRELAARAHKDYRPSVGMCTFGTNVRALAMAEMNADYNTFLLGRRALDRQTEKAHGVASVGTAEDIDDRLIQFRKRYCDPNDNAGLLEKVCAEDIDSATMNKDIDFGRTIGTPWTLALDFSDSEKTGDEQDVLALSSNLFGHSVFENIPDAYFENPQNAYKILDMRSLIAKRSVAQYSFDALTGMKAEGPAEMDKTGGYMKAVLDQLGIPESDIPTLLSGGEATQNGMDTDALLKPSYYGQMEVLTKKIYQNPSFYMTLYDTPANIDRKGAALRAISLMQNTDMLKSRLRSEMLLSVLLETELDPLYKEAQGALDRMRPKGEPDK